MNRDIKHHQTMQCAIDRHLRSLFHGLPRAIASRTEVIKRERERAAVDDVLDGIELEIFRARKACTDN